MVSVHYFTIIYNVTECYMFFIHLNDKFNRLFTRSQQLNYIIFIKFYFRFGLVAHNKEKYLRVTIIHECTWSVDKLKKDFIHFMSYSFFRFFSKGKLKHKLLLGERSIEESNFSSVFIFYNAWSRTST